MKRIRSALLTGSTGFIGSVLLQRLLLEGIEVTCLVRQKPRQSPMSPVPGVRIIDIRAFEREALKLSLAEVKADAVFNLASYGVQPADRDPSLLVEGNVILLMHLLEAVADWPIRRFIHIGSCAEYGRPEQEGVPIVESQVLNPLSLYGAAKAASVLFGTAYASRLELPFNALRLFGVFGAGEAPLRLVPYLIDRLIQDQPVDLTEGEQVRDLTFDGDVAQAFIDAAAADQMEPYAIYNVCSSRPVRVRDVGMTIADALNKPHNLLHWGQRPYRTDEPKWLVGDNRKFVNTTGWRPTVGLEDGIRRVVRARRTASTNQECLHGF